MDLVWFSSPASRGCATTRARPCWGGESERVREPAPEFAAGGRPQSCRGDGRQARLPHGHGRGAGGGAAAFRCRERDGGDRARGRSETLRRHRRLAGQAWRPFARLDSQPHIEELRPRHRRRRICAALARAWNAPLGAIRDAARTRRLRPRRGLEAPEPARNGLRSVQARLAAVFRYGRELFVRRDEAGRLDSKLNRLYGSGRFWPGADWRLWAIDMSKRILTPAAFWHLCSLWEARPFDRRSPRVDFSDLGLVCRRHEARIPILLEGPRHPAVR